MKKDTNSLTESFLNWIAKNFRLCVLIIGCLALINFFGNLGSYPIYDWDEARHGVSAYEMLEKNNYLVTTYLGENDYWNLKPPLGFSLTMLSYKIFGYNAFAMRFPSALAAFLSILLVIYLVKKLYNRPVAILAGMILLTTFWFAAMHSGRSGDFDAQLALIVLLGVTCLAYLGENKKFLYLTGLILGIGFLLKAFAILQLLAIIVVYLILSKRYRELKLHDYLIFGLSAIIPIAIWAYFRYQYDGMTFLKQVFWYDFIQRGTNALDSHTGDPFYYLYNILWGIFPWSLFLFFVPHLKQKYSGIEGKGFWRKTGYQKAFQEPLVLVWLLVPLAMFSCAKTKLMWYINPLYPALAIVIAQVLYDFLKISSPKRKMVMLMLLIFFGLAEIRMLVTVFFPAPTGLEQQILITAKFDPEKKANLYANSFTQSQVFIAEVEKNLMPKSLPDYKKFLELGREGDYLLLDNSAENKQWATLQRLELVNENERFLLVKQNKK